MNQVQKASAARIEVSDFGSEFEKVLTPHNISPDAFVRVVQTAIAENANLESADRKSLILACLKSAADGLVPDGREAALVLFWDKNRKVNMVQYMPMIGGFMKRAYLSGKILKWSLNCVRENDEFSYQLGDDEKLTHIPKIASIEARGNIIAAYSVAVLKSGEKHVEVMGIDEILKIKARSKASSKEFTPWNTDFEEMAKKTVGRRHVKRLPIAADLAPLIKSLDVIEVEGEEHTSGEQITGPAWLPGIEPRVTAETLVEKLFGVNGGKAEILKHVIRYRAQGHEEIAQRIEAALSKKGEPQTTQLPASELLPFETEKTNEEN